MPISPFPGGASGTIEGQLATAVQNLQSKVGNDATADVVLGQDIVLMIGSATPTNGVTGAGTAGPGSLHMNISDAKLRTNTNTKVSPTWTVVGTQT